MAEAADAFIVTRILRHELVAWETQHRESTGRVRLVQFLQTLKLGRKSTLTGRVHNKHDLVLQLSKVEGFALRHSSFQVIKRHHGMWQKSPSA